MVVVADGDGGGEEEYRSTTTWGVVLEGKGAVEKDRATAIFLADGKRRATMAEAKAGKRDVDMDIIMVMIIVVDISCDKLPSKRALEYTATANEFRLQASSFRTTTTIGRLTNNNNIDDLCHQHDDDV